MADPAARDHDRVVHLDELPGHAGRVLCGKYDAVVRDHHTRHSSGVVTWGRHEPCEGPHYRLAVVPCGDRHPPAVG